MGLKRLAGTVTLAIVATSIGGCAVYSTPSGDVIGPAPVIVEPPPVVVVRPWGYGYGHGYWGPRYYGGPRYFGGPGYYGGPRYPVPRPPRYR